MQLQTARRRAGPFLCCIHCSTLRFACYHGARDHPRRPDCVRPALFPCRALAGRPRATHARGAHHRPLRLSFVSCCACMLLQTTVCTTRSGWRSGRSLHWVASATAAWPLQLLHRTAGCSLRARTRLAHLYGVVAAAKRGKRRCVSEGAVSSGRKRAFGALLAGMARNRPPCLTSVFCLSDECTKSDAWAVLAAPVAHAASSC